MSDTPVPRRQDDVPTLVQGAPSPTSDPTVRTPPGAAIPSTEAAGAVPMIPVSFTVGQIAGGRYEIRALLGKGGVGEVWHAFDLKLRVEVALKSLRAMYQHREGMELLRREVRAARQVISPNVCRIFDLVEIDGNELVSMEFIDGQTLLDLLAARGPLDLTEANEIASQFLAGLEAIHRAGLVHRDVKPENVMITRTGRVVVMDFGIAKHASTDGAQTFAGTPAYMAPEQLRGGAVDARTDVFSAGVVLAEMVSSDAAEAEVTTRASLWEAVRHDPPKIADTPWTPVLRRALASDPARRYDSARALARALEEVTLRVEGSETKKPYPGLASFTESDVEFFFGREAEVEAMWKKLRRQHLLLVTGASGSGKSSFLRAGVLAAMPEGWRAVACHPGDAPLSAFAQALAGELSGDAEAVRALLRFDDPDVALSCFRLWRQPHAEVLLVIDQFEELFTLNERDVQARVADLLARLTLEADVHVLLAMRDDFLLHCHAHPSLAPVFSDLTPLSPPAGTALRRALVQPALACGYRFEDDELVAEMLREVSSERGALPLLAFAAARLWEERDRDAGALTRDAYERIGGVAGALARHAEETLERIGADRIPIVREVFRNLVTAEGTRAARDRVELLSVFRERDEAADVLRVLVDARLLTAFETPGGQERIEIIHESLLTAWPRLVHWRTQDVEGAQFRDQLRQAAHLWDGRSRPRDLLWRGSSLREFLLWRDRYTGALTSVEEAFASAMVEQATRNRRIRGGAIVLAFAVMVAIISVTAKLWQRSELARREAVAQTKRAEASRLFALGRLEIDRNPTGALSFALASLQLGDDPAVRLFALNALWRQPPATVIAAGERLRAEFSPDGRWIADGGRDGTIRLWSRDGGPPGTIRAHASAVRFLRFTAGSDLLVSAASDDTVRLWSVPSGTEIRSLRVERLRGVALASEEGAIVTFSGTDGALAQAWPLAGGEPRSLGVIPTNVSEELQAVDAGGDAMAWGRERAVWVRPLRDTAASAVLVGEHDEAVSLIAFSPDGRRFASASRSGEIRVWSRDSVPPRLLVAYRGGGEIRSLSFDGSGARLAAGFAERIVRVWDFDDPPDAAPLTIRGMAETDVNSAALDGSGERLVVTSDRSTTLFALGTPRARILRGHTGRIFGLAFSPDGKWIASSGEDGTIRLWAIRRDAPGGSRILFEDPTDRLDRLAVDGRARTVVAASSSGRVHHVSVDGRTRALTGFNGAMRAVAADASGRFVAGAGGVFDFSEAVIRIWDLQSGETFVLDPEDDNYSSDLRFNPDGLLYSASATGIRLWNPADQTFRLIDPAPSFALDVTKDDRRLVAVQQNGVVLRDLVTGRATPLRHGGRVVALAVDPEGTRVATGDENGFVRVGPLSRDEPSILLGHEGTVVEVAFSPDGAWLATAGFDRTVRLWRLGDDPPLHALPYGELLERLAQATNVRAVPDRTEPSGYRLDGGRFVGWR